MVTSAPSFASVEQVLAFIPDNDLAYYSSLDEDEILAGHVCTCEEKSKWGNQGDQVFYRLDKTGIGVCSQCGGYFGRLFYNW